MAVKAKVIILLLFSLFFINFASGLTFPQNQNSTLCHAVRQDGAISSSMNCNITILNPDGSSLVNFLAMTNLNDRFCFNLTQTHTSQKGIYNYDVTCNNGTLSQTETFSYNVNLGGIEPSPERTDTLTRTIYIFFALGILSFAGFFFTRKLPVRMTLILLMIWFILMGLNTAYISMQDEIVNTNIESFFSFFLTLSFYMNYFVFMFIIIIWMTTFIITILEGKKKKLEDSYGF